ncbi:AAA ATPase midasin, partial [Coemansia sp. RSA 1933]
RLNSVLEPSRTLVLAENVGAASLTAAEGFEFVATMNPGGDYGKRELSPALRNRFTELWAPTTQDRDDLQLVLLKRMEAVPDADACASVILDFVACLRDDLKTLQHPLSLRDYLFWADFVARTHGLLGARASVVHGACLVLLDGVGAQGSIFGASTARLPSAVKAECVGRLRRMVGWSDGAGHGEHDIGVVPARALLSSSGDSPRALAARIEHREDGRTVGVAPFFVECGLQGRSDDIAFALDAPTTFDNLVKILRAMQVGKPLLLEGSPGVGKTTLVATLARLAGHRLVRINLSDQTDLMDLFGTDLPVDGGFAWCDAPFLQALKRGDWVLLDEINLASQSVLEGLNSCLDHRGTVYIAELDREFTLAPGFRLFAAQNPLGQGGGRKGLPRSFVNRFTQVYMDELARDDLLTICNTVYAGHAADTGRVLDFNWRMHDATMTRRQFGAAGAPWEFNLRDVSRFMELALQPSVLERGAKPVDEFVAMLYVQRMRSPHDRAHVVALFRDVFGRDLDLSAPLLHATSCQIQIGSAVLPRLSGGGDRSMDHVTRLSSLHGQLGYLESLAKCIEMRWMAILVGPAGCGKTSMVRWLANATGNRLVEFSMNSGVDTSEIIGGFEQVDAQRHRASLLARVDELLRKALLLGGESAPSAPAQAIGSATAQTMSRAYGLFHAAKRCIGTRNLCAAVDQILDCVGGLVGLDGLIGVARREAGELAELEAAGRFEWVDGVLVDALVHGHWLLVDRANLCSASVLDRLNGLLEPNGVLYVTEDPKRTSAVVPHANFRIIMAVDPMHGELSRAMRNRGIEICVLPPGTETDDARHVRAADHAAVAWSVGLSGSLIPADMKRESSLTAVVHQAVRATERTQRGYAACLDGASAGDLVASRYAPAANGSAVSVASWQARMARLALNSASALERMALLLAVVGTLPPDAGSMAAAMFSSILQTDSKDPPAVVGALLAAPLGDAMRQARDLVAAEGHIDADVLASAPAYTALNASLLRALLRYGKDSPAVLWHQTLCVALQFQRERIAAAGANHLSDSASVLHSALQRPDIDVAYVQGVLALADQCDVLVDEWDAAVADRHTAADALAAGCDLAACVPVLRSIHRLACRIRLLIGSDGGGSSSALAVAFEETQGVLQQMARAQLAVVGDRVQGLLEAVRPLVLDAAHSAKIWALEHPTTLCDENEREIEALLLAGSGEAAAADQREAVVEALAMLYATARHSSRRLIVDAVGKYARSLPAAVEKAKKPAGESVPTPADVLADACALGEWHSVAQLAVLASGGTSQLQSVSVAQLRGDTVKRMAVGGESPWAPAFARLSWALNEHASAGKPLDVLPLVCDIIDRWHEQLGSQTLAGVLDEPTLRLTRPVATELTWRSAASLGACTLADHGRIHSEAIGLLRALATYTPPAKMPGRDLAALVWLLARTIGAVCGSAEECNEFQRRSAQIAVLLANGDGAELSQQTADSWHRALDRAAAADGRVAECVAPAAASIRAALASSKADMPCHVLAATVAVHIGVMTLSFPRREVDPAARAHTRWAWLGEDIAAARADRDAYTKLQQAMTGDSDTVATRPFARAVGALETQQAAIERVYRPKKAPPFAELWQEARSLCTSVFARVRDVCAQLMGAPEEGGPLPLQAAHALVATLSQFQARVRGRYYGAFRDVAQIWCMHARAIAHALAGLADERSRADAKTAVRREYAELIASVYAMPVADAPATGTSAAALAHALARLKTMVFFAKQLDGGDGQAGGGGSPVRAYGELVRALLLRTTLGIQARGRVAPADIAALGAVFGDAHDIHRRAVEAKRKRDAEAASLFKSRAPAEQTDDDLVRELFPGYEDLFADDDDGAGAGADKSSRSSPADDDLDGDTATALAACHQYVMLQFSSAECAPDLRAPLVREAQQAALDLAASAYAARHDVAALQPDGADDMLRASNMAALAAVASKCDSAEGTATGGSAEGSGIRMSAVRDFYRDAWPREAVRVRPVAQALADRAVFLLEEWPEHAGLQMIRDTARRLLAEPVTSPVARLLAGVEQLHLRAQDAWEAYASRDVSMGAELAAAAALIVRWRQTELNAWPHVLRAQELACARRAGTEWWFSLYAVLAAPGGGSADVAELSAALDHFAHGCPAGEFRARLNLLLAFASHRAALVSARAASEGIALADALRADGVYGPLANATGYYLQYASCVGEHLARAKKPVQKDLAQYVKISSWKDVNPTALRVSAQRTHRHLAKCVRLWREALAQPVFQIIQAHQTATIAAAHVPAVSPVPTPLADAGFDVAPAPPVLRGDAASPWAAAGLDGGSAAAAAAVAGLARSADAELARVLDASPAALLRLRRLMQSARVFGKQAAGADV